MTPPLLRPRAQLALGAAVLATGFAATTAHADAKQPLPAIDFKHGHLRVHGGDAADKVVLRVPASRPDRLEVDLGDDGSSQRRIVLRRIDRITVATAGGADSIRVEDAVTPLQAAVTLDGGDDADTLIGGSAEEFIVGGAGDDAVDGGRGDDVAFLGSGADTFGRDPGEGSDVVRARPARTSSRSAAPPAPRSSSSPRTARGRACSGTSGPSRWTSRASRPRRRARSAAPTR